MNGYFDMLVNGYFDMLVNGYFDMLVNVNLTLYTPTSVINISENAGFISRVFIFDTFLKAFHIQNKISSS